jgi:hypothetical protein
MSQVVQQVIRPTLKQNFKVLQGRLRAADAAL